MRRGTEPGTAPGSGSRFFWKQKWSYYTLFGGYCQQARQICKSATEESGEDTDRVGGDSPIWVQCVTISQESCHTRPGLTEDGMPGVAAK